MDVFNESVWVCVCDVRRVCGDAHTKFGMFGENLEHATHNRPHRMVHTCVVCVYVCAPFADAVMLVIVVVGCVSET